MPGAAPVLDDSCMAAHGQLDSKSIASLKREPVVRHAALQCFLKGEVGAHILRTCGTRAAGCFGAACCTQVEQAGTRLHS